ncbi:MAG: MBL fold metallo-hydrolase [Patescibacteria group bacterium]
MFFSKTKITKIKWAIVLILFLANIFVWRAVFLAEHGGKLTLAMLDIGQGDAIFIQDSVGHQILIDGGPDQKILARLPALMPVSDRSLDLLIVSHPHADHIAGLVEILNRYEVGAVMEAGAVYSSAIYAEWHRLLAEKKIPIIPAFRGEKISLARGAALEILAPFEDWRGRSAKEIHDSMVVARLTVNGRGLAMLTGDMETDLEDKLIASANESENKQSLEAIILKVGHHGSKTSSGRNFVQKVSPSYAVISVGTDNRYGHPYPATLATFENLNIKTLQTNQTGTIVFEISDKNKNQPLQPVFLES